MSQFPRRRSITLPLLAAALLAMASIAAEDTPLNLFEEALQVSQELDPATDPAQCRAEWRKLLDKVGAAVTEARAAGPLKPAQVIETLNRELLINRNVSYISNRYWRDSLFTAALMKKQGNCLATSLLYYLVARELKLPISMAFMPEHAFVRWDDGTTIINVETTNQGKPFPDEAMLAHFELTREDLEPNGFLCQLSERQIYARLLSVWGGVLFTLERRPEAFAYLQRAQKLAPGNPELRMQEMSFLMFDGRTDQAHAILQELIEAPNAGPWAKATAALSYAHWLESRGKADEAIELLQAHYEDAPRGVKVRMIDQLGVLYRHKRDFDKAIYFHKFYVLLHPDEGGYNELASALTEAHRDAEAIAAYEKALGFNPESFFTKVILAGLYERAGDKEKGRAYFAAIDEPRDHKITWHSALVWYYANIKEPALMIQHMDAAFKLDGSGQAYQYFVREPDLDAYRKDPEFIRLMRAHAPPDAAPPPDPQPEKPAPEKEAVGAGTK